MLKVLMTGGGAPGGPGIIRCIQKDPGIKLLVGDANPEASGRFLNQDFVQLPNASSESFVADIYSISRQHKIDVLFPLVTNELFRLSEFKHLFDEAGIKVIVSEHNSLQIANNKTALYRHLREKEISTPLFYVGTSLKDVDEGLAALGFPNNAVCIKPSISNGSRGVRIVDDNISRHDLLFNHKPNSLYITSSELRTVLSEAAFPELLISEYLPGEEYTIDTIIDQGYTVMCIPRRRDLMNAGISTRGTFEYHEEIVSYVNQIAGTLNLNGPIGFQVKADKAGKFRILEINPRIQGTSVAAMGLGINLPLLAIYQAVGKKVKFPDPKSLPWGTKFVRIYEELYY